MRLHSVFLRNDCILPDPLNPLRIPFGNEWMQVEEIPAPVFDTMIRQAGWHFIWMSGSCSRNGYARTRDRAIEIAVDRALDAIPKQSNAADFDSFRVSKYLGFFIANVTVFRRRIQQRCVLEAGGKPHLRALHAR